MNKCCEKCGCCSPGIGHDPCHCICHTPVQEENPVIERNGFITRKENFPSSESWVETFEKKFPIVEVQIGDDKYTDLKPEIISFIKNTITAEVERGRIEVVEEIINKARHTGFDRLEFINWLEKLLSNK